MIQVQGFYPELLPAKNTLQNTSWADIATVAAAGRASEYWAVGDTKTIAFGSAVFGSTTITVKILDFYYDDLADGNGKAAISFGMVDCFANTRAMNSSNTNAGGWSGSAMRSALISTVLPALQSAIGAGVIKAVAKRTTAGDKSTSIVTSSDSVWLMSQYEVSGAGYDEKPVDKSAGYAAFTNNASRIKKVGSSAAIWWGRGPYVGGQAQFYIVTEAGAATSVIGAQTAQGVSVGFCV